MKSGYLLVSRETSNGKCGDDGFCISSVVVAWVCEAAAEEEREQEGIRIPGLSPSDTWRLDWLISQDFPALGCGASYSITSVGTPK